MQFTEKTRIEEGFAAVYSAKIAPELERMETKRQALMAQAKRQIGIPFGIAAVLALLTLLVSGFEDAVFVLVVTGVMSALAALWIWSRHAEKWKGSIAETVMPVVCDFIGDVSYDRKARARFPVDTVRALGMVGEFSRSKLSDRLEGSYRDVPFELVEAHLESESGKDDRRNTVFKGIFFRIGLPEPAPTTILIARDHTEVANKIMSYFAGDSGRGMPRVEVDHARFEQAFEVHADDPDAARDFLPPAFLDNLLEIAENEGEERGLEKMTAGFQGEWFYLALGREADFLEMGSLRKPVHGIEDDLHRAFADITLVHRVIDRLHGDAPQGEPPQQAELAD